VAAAIEAADATGLAAVLGSAGSASILVSGDPVLLGPDDVIITRTPRSGWAVATEGGETVALEVTITPELRREGLAREVVRLVQDARKGDGLDVSDRISLQWAASDPELVAALTEHGPMISGEVLADRYGERPAAGADPAARAHCDSSLGLAFWISPIEPAPAAAE